MSLVYFLLGPISPLPEAATTPRHGGTLRFALVSDILNVNPFVRTLSVNKDVGSLSFECLLTADKNGELKPSLATAWETSKDGLQYTFKLRKGVWFHNGKEMTAEDVLWSMNYAMDPKNGAYGRDKLLPIASMTASDPWTLVLTLKEPYVPFLVSLTSHQAFPVVPKGSLPLGTEKLELYPPGTGPFRMVEHRSNQLMAFKRFDQYWQKGIPYLDGINFRPIEDDTVRLTALRTEELDVAERVPHDQALRIQKGELKVLGLKVAEASGYLSLIFNTESSPFNNVKVRQAAAYAMDKPKIIEGISWGFGFASDQKILKGSRWFVPLKDRERDVGKAKALLKEAGYPNGLKVKGHVPRLKTNHDAMQVILSQLREAGIQIDLEIKDFVTHQNALREGQFTVTVMGGLPYLDPDLAYYQYFHTEQSPVRVSNFPRYSNPRVDRLLDDGRTEPDFQKRYRIYKEVVEILNEELPQITLGYTPYVHGFRTYVKDFDIHPNNQFFYGVGGLAMTWLDR